jgi:hypothetical protein
MVSHPQKISVVLVGVPKATAALRGRHVAALAPLDDGAGDKRRDPSSTKWTSTTSAFVPLMGNNQTLLMIRSFQTH